MGLTIDHIVILVQDLEAASTDYTKLGFTVVPGGEHTDGATHNALIAFADGSYLELIAFKRPAPEHVWWRYVALGEGLVDMALLPDNITENIAAARQRGLPFDGPIPGGRLRPDGQAIAWQLGRPHTSDLPFLCADVTPRRLRVPDGLAWQHANGVSGIAGLTVMVTNLDVSVDRYRALLGDEPTTYIPERLAASGARGASFGLGNATITLVTPPPAASEHPLHAHLAVWGEGPYSLDLRTNADAGTYTLDPPSTHGVRLTLLTNPHA